MCGTVTCRDNGDIVPRSSAAIIAEIPEKGCSAQLGIGRPGYIAKAVLNRMKGEVVLVDVFPRRNLSAGDTDFFAVAPNRLTSLDESQGNFVTGGNGVDDCHDRWTCLNTLAGRQKNSSDGYVVIRMQENDAVLLRRSGIDFDQLHT
jgi:hypothetical protein